jgi:hypothetical protein
MAKVTDHGERKNSRDSKCPQERKSSPCILAHCWLPRQVAIRYQMISIYLHTCIRRQAAQKRSGGESGTQERGYRSEHRNKTSFSALRLSLSYSYDNLIVNYVKHERRRANTGSRGSIHGYCVLGSWVHDLYRFTVVSYREGSVFASGSSGTVSKHLTTAFGSHT